MSFEKRKNNDIIIIGHQVTLPYCTIRSGVTYPATSTSTVLQWSRIIIMPTQYRTSWSVHRGVERDMSRRRKIGQKRQYKTQRGASSVFQKKNKRWYRASIDNRHTHTHTLLSLEEEMKLK